MFSLLFYFFKCRASLSKEKDFFGNNWQQTQFSSSWSPVKWEGGHRHEAEAVWLIGLLLPTCLSTDVYSLRRENGGVQQAGRNDSLWGEREGLGARLMSSKRARSNNKCCVNLTGCWWQSERTPVHSRVRHSSFPSALALNSRSPCFLAIRHVLLLSLGFSFSPIRLISPCYLHTSLRWMLHITSHFTQTSLFIWPSFFSAIR